MKSSQSRRASRFSEFELDPRILDAVGRLGFSTPTPIQSEAIPAALTGKNVIGRARTGSGKTAAFGLPLLERVANGGATTRGLVLTPTRELALQVTQALRSFAKNLPVRIVTIYGGTPYRPQLKALQGPAPVVVGTPGRVLDHVEKGTLDLSDLETVVLDEADELLRMGFIEEVDRILARAPRDRQVVLFSATMPGAIKKIVAMHCPDPISIQVEEAALSVDHVRQQYVVVPQHHRLDALARILASEPSGAALVFARTRAECAEVADELARAGIAVDALHGDLNQGARERVLLRFRSGALKIVVATDVAARGIDVEHITHVVNLELPTDVESYVHRIGRTGRAGRDGTAITLVTQREVPRIRNLERTLRVKVEAMGVPSDARIAERRKHRLLSRLVETREAPAGLLRLYEELSDGISAREIAMSALELLARSEGIDLAGSANPEPPAWTHERPSHPSKKVSGRDRPRRHVRGSRRMRNEDNRPQKHRRNKGPSSRSRQSAGS